MSFVGKEFILSLGFYVKAKRKKKIRRESDVCVKDTLKQVVLTIKWLRSEIGY